MSIRFYFYRVRFPLSNELRPEPLKTLIALGADLSLRVESDGGENAGCTALHLAVMRNNYTAVKLLLHANVSLHAKNAKV